MAIIFDFNAHLRLRHLSFGFGTRGEHGGGGGEGGFPYFAIFTTLFPPPRQKNLDMCSFLLGPIHLRPWSYYGWCAVPDDGNPREGQPHSRRVPPLSGRGVYRGGLSFPIEAYLGGNGLLKTPQPPKSPGTPSSRYGCIQGMDGEEYPREGHSHCRRVLPLPGRGVFRERGS